MNDHNFIRCFHSSTYTDLKWLLPTWTNPWLPLPWPHLVGGMTHDRINSCTSLLWPTGLLTFDLSLLYTTKFVTWDGHIYFVTRVCAFICMCDVYCFHIWPPVYMYSLIQDLCVASFITCSVKSKSTALQVAHTISKVTCNPRTCRHCR